jgi:hypothetical protein
MDFKRSHDEGLNLEEGKFRNDKIGNFIGEAAATANCNFISSYFGRNANEVEKNVNSIQPLQSQTPLQSIANLRNLQTPKIDREGDRGDIKHNLNLNKLLYEEIQKTNQNSCSMIQSHQTNNQPNSNNNSNSIIVTNISNLQVNISQNSYNEKIDRKKYSDKYDKYRRRDRSRSRTPESKRRKNKRRSTSRSRSPRMRYRSRSRARSRSRIDNKKANNQGSNSPSSRVKNYTIPVTTSYSKYQVDKVEEKDLNSLSEKTQNIEFQIYTPNNETLLNENLLLGIEIKGKRNIDEENDSPKRKISKALGTSSLNNESKGDGKIIKNKLFSNAMEKIAMNYLRRDPRGKN